MITSCILLKIFILKMANPLSEAEKKDGSLQEAAAAVELEVVSRQWSSEPGRVLVDLPWGGREVCLVSGVEEVAWSPALAAHLEESGVREASSLQAAAWPAVTSLRSVFLVAAGGQGKTLGWLLPLLSQLLDPLPYLALPAAGPVAVVVCGGHDEAARIGALATSLLAGAGADLRVEVTKPGRWSRSTAAMVDTSTLLVTTAPRLTRLLGEGAVSLARCCHLVVESAHISLELHHALVGELVVAWRRARSARGRAPDQVIVVGETWSAATRALLHLVGPRWRPAVVVAALLEAAIYSSTTLCPSLHTTEEGKVEELQELVRARPCGLVVACRSPACHQVAAAIREVGEAVELAGSALVAKEEVAMWGRRGSRGALVLGDHLLYCLPRWEDNFSKVVQTPQVARGGGHPGALGPAGVQQEGVLPAAAPPPPRHAPPPGAGGAAPPGARGARAPPRLAPPLARPLLPPTPGAPRRGAPRWPGALRHHGGAGEVQEARVPG